MTKLSLDSSTLVEFDDNLDKHSTYISICAQTWNILVGLSAREGNGHLGTFI